MTHQTIIISFIIILALFYPLNRPSNDVKNSTILMTFEYVNGNTTSHLTINKSSVNEEILRRNGLKPVPAFSKNSQKIAHSNSTTESSGIFLNDMDISNFTFDEKAREDTFEKRPATESPHAVLLLMYYSQLANPGVCSGSLLTPDWVLTAAHCLTPPENRMLVRILVYAGGYSSKEVESNNLADGSQVRQGKMILPHPKYNGKHDYDVGLVMVSESFNVTDTVKTVEISTQPWNHRGYRKCQLTGFGIVQIGENRADDKVRKTHTLDVKQPCLCSFRLKMLLGAGKVNRYICARPRLDYGVCSGDSGGGLICDGQIRAVAMQIVQLLETTMCEMQLMPNIQCGSPDALSIFQDSCPFLRWVNSHVRMFNDSQISGECVDRGAASRPLRGGGLLLLLVLFNAIVDTMLFTN